MNMRRGLFRLWIVLSVAFFVGVAVVSYDSIHDEFKNAHVDWDAEVAKYGGYTMLPVNCGDIRGILGTDYSRNDDGLCWFRLADFRRLYPEYKDLNNRALSEKLYTKVGQPLQQFHPWKDLILVSSRAVGIPLAVLGVGWSLLWAFNGFRRSS